MNCKPSLLILLAVVVASQGSSKKLMGRSFSTSTSSYNSTSYIYDGKSTTIQKHPYLLVLQYGGEYIGAATIVSSRWVIFAAIMAAFPIQEISVVAGSQDGSSGQTYFFKKIVLHPKYKSSSRSDYCYALGQIEGKFKWSKKVKPIKLAAKQPKANTPMVVASWGDTRESLKASNSELMQGTMNWLSPQACKAAYRDYAITFTSRIGCVYNKGKTTLCRGDWFAPFVSKNKLYGYFIGTDTKLWCSPNAIPDLVANVPTVASWIKKVTGAKTEDDEE